MPHEGAGTHGHTTYCKWHAQNTQVGVYVCIHTHVYILVITARAHPKHTCQLTNQSSKFLVPRFLISRQLRPHPRPHLRLRLHLHLQLIDTWRCRGSGRCRCRGRCRGWWRRGWVGHGWWGGGWQSGRGGGGRWRKRWVGRGGGNKRLKTFL